jgi:serine protease Do
MDEKIVLRYTQGSKTGRVEEFPLEKARATGLTVGRESTCEIAFDADKDDLVSRTHSKITVEGDNPPNFWIGDLGSRNGTYVNKQRISSRVKLMPGDIVQLGPGGPEFEFDMNPRPAGMVRATRLASDMPHAPAMTREASAPPVMPMPMGPPPMGGAPAGAPMGMSKPPGTVGKATVERMIHDTQKKSSKTLMYVIAAGVAVILIGAAAFWGKVVQMTTVKTMTPTQIAEMYNDSVVLIETGWKLVDTQSGLVVNQLYIPNEIKCNCAKPKPIVQGGPAMLPVFVPADSGLEPVLTTETNDGKNKAIGGNLSGSGFVVSSDGFILTNRHVAASWFTTYDFSDEVGLAVVKSAGKTTLEPVKPPQGWVPGDAKVMLKAGQGIDDIGQFVQGKTLEGRNDYLDVTFAQTRIRVPAKTARVSDHADVTMIQISLPKALKKCELYDNWDTIKAGDAAVVMGYPGVSALMTTKAVNVDDLGTQGRTFTVPVPTVTATNVSQLVRGKAAITDAVRSNEGDLYQLSTSATGHGNSGGPTFDDHGRVVGIFVQGKATAGAAVTYALPIRYGMELMGLTKVL